MEIITGIEVKPYKIGLSGTGGVGKTTLAAEFPNPIIVRCEDRHSHIPVAKLPLCDKLGDVIAQLDWLADTKHEYKTVIVDSVDWLETLIHKDLCAAKGKKSIADLGYGVGYAQSEMVFREVLEQLDYLRDYKKMHVVCIAHTQVERFSDPLSEDYDRYTIAMHKKVSSAFIEWVDNLFFLNIPHYTRKDDNGKIKGAGVGDRIIYTQTNPAYMAKNSFGFDAEIPYVLGEGYKAISSQYKRWLVKNGVEIGKKKNENTTTTV